MATARRSRTSDASDGLTIACKLPQGLHIKNEKHGIDLKLHGTHSPYAVAGHGMTRGVRPEVWAAIETIYADAKWLKNDVAFAMSTPESAADKAAEREKVNAGFDPIDPNNPGATRGASTIQVDGEGDPGAR